MKLPPLPIKPKPRRSEMAKSRAIAIAAKAHGPKPRWPLAARFAPAGDEAE